MKRSYLIGLTEIDIIRIKSLAHFTELQEEIFNELCKDQPDYAIMQKLCISNRKFYENKPLVLQKAEQILFGTKPKK